MTKRLTQQLTYAAPLAEVAAMLRTSEFREAVCQRQRALSHAVDITEDGAGADIQVSRELKVEGIPSFAAKFVGETITIMSREQWSSATAGTYTVGIPDKPGSIEGTVTLSEADGVTTETVDLQIKVSVPLIGAKLESVVSDLLGKALHAEHAVGVAHLQG